MQACYSGKPRRGGFANGVLNSYSSFYEIKGNDEEEYTYPLTRESGCIYALEGCFKTGMWKVASKPEGRDRIFRA